MALTINLLGKPFAERDGERLPPPRGRKAWGLLAYLACTRRAHSREHLASLLFADAADPLGALRWSLAEVRRLVGRADLSAGELITVERQAGSIVDVDVLASGTWTDALALPGLGKELLEGMSFASSAPFDAWLLNERRHQQAASNAMMREGALGKLGAGRTDEAIDLAARLVAVDPLDEPAQELLIRCYAVAGDRRAAQRQLAACIDLFGRELGVEPGPGVFAAADVSSGSSSGRAVSGRAAARAQLEAGRAAIDAGAVDAGIECLRRAVSEAQGAGEMELKAAALVALGSTFVHMVRGRDEEGAAVLHEALSLTERTGQAHLTAQAMRELAWIEVLVGRYDRAFHMLDQALTRTTDDAERGATFTMIGAAHLETGAYTRAREMLGQALTLASEPRARTEALAEMSRLHAMVGDLGLARAAAAEARELARAARLASMGAILDGVLGFIDAMTGADVARAESLLEDAFAFGCQIGDPCAESSAAHGLGMLLVQMGDPDAAIETLRDAYQRCTRRGDSSVWFAAWALDSLCTVAIRERHPGVGAWVAELESLAGRTGMRDFLARAYLHRAHLGDASALQTAEVLAAHIESRALERLIAEARDGETAR